VRPRPDPASTPDKFLFFLVQRGILWFPLGEEAGLHRTKAEQHGYARRETRRKSGSHAGACARRDRSVQALPCKSAARMARCFTWASLTRALDERIRNRLGKKKKKKRDQRYTSAGAIERRLLVDGMLTVGRSRPRYMLREGWNRMGRWRAAFSFPADAARPAVRQSQSRQFAGLAFLVH